MGIFNFAKKQLIDVLEWNEEMDGVLQFRYPMADREIQNGGQLTVRESQLAIFVNEGKVADVFGPGLHRLETRNLPVLTNLKNWDKGFESPFKSDVYFFSTRDQLDQKWGTPQPITVRDREFGPIRLRTFGNFSYRVVDPRLFFTKVSGTRETYTVDEVGDQLRAIIQTSLATTLGTSEIGFVDMAANQTAFSEKLKASLEAPIAAYGLGLQSFNVQSISLPEELQQYLDKSSQMRLVGELRKYAQFQAADSIPAAAQNPGGLAGAGIGLSAGIGMGQIMAESLGQGAGGSGGGSGGDPVSMLNQLHELLTKGILTQSEFDAKKAELLKKIT